MSGVRISWLHVGQEVGAGLGQRFGRLAGAFPGAAEGTLAVVVEGQAVAQRFQAEQQAADFIVALHVRAGLRSCRRKWRGR